MLIAPPPHAHLFSKRQKCRWTGGVGATRGDTTISQKRIQQLAMRARVRPAASNKRALPAGAASAMTGESMARAARATSGK